ncbi:MAG: YggS family pyridoxal phosphate-dependent enzyme [Thermoleophilaceae bacterium]|nr:YggS family pyridoxal phosphate-dependent enzyme [Thermoleophilaceae bacterium]
MAGLSADLATVSGNLERIGGEVADACARSGRDAASVTLCVATKYVEPDAMAVLRDAGVAVAAENRLQDMIAKQERFGDAFDWHFIGAIQSRKVREIASRVSTIHSLATESARDKLVDLDFPAPRLLVQVNISGEQSKQGVRPEELDDFIAGTAYPVTGLMTMPPLTDEPEGARPYFAKLKEMADQRGLAELSMGTSQDYVVAVEEGATLIRVGSVVFDQSNK